jgi:ABC-type branched-subunit amino acid transport system substrate-binding protein
VGTSLRYSVVGTECSPSAAVEAAISQVAGVDPDRRAAVFVGGMCPEASSAVAHLLRAFEVPLVSFRSVASEQSDPTVYPFFLRTVPSAETQGAAVGALAAHLGVTRAGALHGSGEFSDIAGGFRGGALQHEVSVPSSSFERIVNQRQVEVGGKAYVLTDLTLVCKLQKLHNNGDSMRHFLFSLQSGDLHYAAAAIHQSGYLRGDRFMYYGVESWSLTEMEDLEDSALGLWWYNSDNLGGFWAIQGAAEDKHRSGNHHDGDGPPIVVPLEHIGGNLQSISLGGGCGTIGGGASEVAGSDSADRKYVVSLGERSGSATLGGGGGRIIWTDGEVWEQLPPPKLSDLQDIVKGSLGLVADTSDPSLNDYIDNIWKTQPVRYNFDTANTLSENFRTENLGWHDSDGDRSTVQPCAPFAFDAATAVAFALDAVISEGGDTNDGELLKKKMLGVEFEGLSGRVSFSDSGDRSFSKYTIINQKGAGKAPSEVGALRVGSEMSVQMDGVLAYRGGTSSFPGDGGCSSNLGELPCSAHGTCVYGSGHGRLLLGHPQTGTVLCSCFEGHFGDKCQHDEPLPMDMGIILGIGLPLGFLALAFVGIFIHRMYFSHLARAHVFISYKHKDKELADAVRADLEKRGNNVWIDTQITPGEDWKGEIASAICDSVCVVFLASKEAVKSRYCREEILFASSINKNVVTLLAEDCVKDMRGGMRMVLMRKQFLDIRGGRFGPGMSTCCKLIRNMRLGRQSIVMQNFGRKTTAQVLSPGQDSHWRKKASSIFFPTNVTPEQIEEQVDDTEVVVVSSAKDVDISQNILESLKNTSINAIRTKRHWYGEDEAKDKDTMDYAENAARIKKTKLILFLETEFSMGCSDCNDEVFFAYENQVPILRAQLAENAAVMHYSGSMAMMLNISPVIVVQRKKVLQGGGSGVIARRVLHEFFVQESSSISKNNKEAESRRGSRRKSSLMPNVSSRSRTALGSGGSMANIGALFGGRQGSVTIQTMLAKRTSSAFNLGRQSNTVFPAAAVDQLRSDTMPTGDVV